jgi:hypothetical protein
MDRTTIAEREAARRDARRVRPRRVRALAAAQAGAAPDQEPEAPRSEEQRGE